MESAWSERELVGQAEDLPDEVIRELDKLDEERLREVQELGRYLARSQPTEDEIQLVSDIERAIAEKLGVSEQVNELRSMQNRRRQGDREAR